MALTLVLYCVAVVCVSALGGLLPLLAVLTHKRLQIFLSFAAGTMMGAVFFHMLPEAVVLGGTGTLRWAALGLLALFFLERFFSFHHHESAHVNASVATEEDQTVAAHVHGVPELPSRGSVLDWGAAALGLAAHTLVGGFALASAVAASASTARSGTAWGVFLATLLHKPADALTLVSLMLRARVPRGWAHVVNLVFSLLLPIGVSGFFLARYWIASGSSALFTASALSFSAGTFLCISLSDLLPELQFHQHDRLELSVGLLSGIGLMALTGLAG